MDIHVNQTIEKERILCESLIEENRGFKKIGVYCPMKFDGWTCWNDTPNGTIANTSCPDFIPGFQSTRTVYHKCDEDGSWHFNIAYQKVWVNYTTCIDFEHLYFWNKLIAFQTFGYSISLVALLISLGLLFHFKSLRCARILIHMNLFASFAIYNFLWLIWNNFIVTNVEISNSSKHQAWCIPLHIILYTCLISNYSWMLCEGLYLHTVLVWAFISQSHLLMWMLIIGWGIPILNTIIYVPVRIFTDTEDDLGKCWDNPSKARIIQEITVAVALVINCLFLINIVRVLVTKLRQGPANDGQGVSRSTLQALRATLLLVPLFGLNFFITPVRPDSSEPEGEPEGAWEYAYELIYATITSYQGLCVAILFCFRNGEVQAQIQRKWNTAMFRPRANSCTVTTVSFVRSSYPAQSEENVGLGAIGRRASNWIGTKKKSTMVQNTIESEAQCV